MYLRAACPEFLLPSRSLDSGSWRRLKPPQPKGQFLRTWLGASDCLTTQPGRQCRLLMAFEEACAYLAELAHVPPDPLPSEQLFRCVPGPIAGHLETPPLSRGRNRPAMSSLKLMNRPLTL